MRIHGKISKVDDEQHLVFGWFSVAAANDGTTIVDSDNDTIPIAELERAAYDFVLNSRNGGEMHERTGVATLIESIVFTPEKIAALGLQQGALPYGWFGGFKVTDEDVWQRIKSGEYSMFSWGGRATREALTNE